MKKTMILFVLAVLSQFAAMAQVRLYDEMCDPLQAVFCDYVENESSQNFLSSASGQYTGTLIDNKIYGWGYF